MWSRVVALFVGFWFVAVSAGPELAHACPMHGSHALASVAGGGHRHAVSAAGHHSGASSESAPHPGTQCTCLGHCCATGPVALVAAAAGLLDAVTAAPCDRGLSDYTYVQVAGRHVLPLANAPPQSA